MNNCRTNEWMNGDNEEEEEKSKRKISWCASLLVGIRMEVDVIFMSTMTKRWTIEHTWNDSDSVEIRPGFHSFTHSHSLFSSPSQWRALIEMIFWCGKLWKGKRWHGSHFIPAFFLDCQIYFVSTCVCLFVYHFELSVSWNIQFW